MIFATDLDRTLIFSEKFIADHPSSSETVVTETLNGQIISRAATEVIDGLKKLSETVMIIPVTSRSAAEYCRVNLGISFEYAIISNGGIILHNGMELPEWNNVLNKTQNADRLSALADAVNSLKSIDYPTKIIDESYVFSKTTDSALCLTELEVLQDQFPDITLTLQVKKLYAVPKSFSKAKALSWLKSFLGETVVVAAGDSALDVDMLQTASYSVAPDHGSIVLEGLMKPDHVVGGGIVSPLKTFELVKQISKSHQ